MNATIKNYICLKSKKRGHTAAIIQPERTSHRGRSKIKVDKDRSLHDANFEEE